MKFTKKLLVIALAAMMVLGMASCGKQAEEPANRLEAILAAGKITVAVSPDFAPFEFVDPDLSGQDQYQGAEMTLARYIAEQLGVEVEFQTMDFATCQTAVAAGSVDLSISGYSYTAERAETMALSDFYNIQVGEASTQGVMVLAGEAATYKTAEDFSGKKVGAQNGSLQQALTEGELVPAGAEIELLANVQDAVNMMVAGRLDAVAMENSVGAMFMQTNNNVEMAEFQFDHHDEGTVLAAPLGEEELMAKMNEIIATVNAEGLFQQWVADATARAAELGLEM